MESILITKIKPAKYNPRVISESALSALVESVRKFGMPQPLVVNRRSGTLVSGHQRLRAAEKLGWTEVPVVYVDLTHDQEKALNITLNNKNIEGSYTEAVSVLVDEIREALGEDFISELRLDELILPEVDNKTVTGAQEYGEEEFKEFAHQCPRCNFEFN